MKIQLLMKGRDSKGYAQFYRTITEAEFARVFGVVTANDGKRPWEASTQHRAND